jgi:uncharacterized protein YoxC
MPLGDFTAIDVLWICLSAFLVLVGVTLAYLLVRLSGTAVKLTRLIKGLEESVVPLVHKTGGTLDRVNLQLDKVDLVTDSAVSAADSLDTAVRAVSLAITRPVQKLSAVAKGLSHGASALVAGKSVREAVAAGRDAASRREQEIAEELARRDRWPKLGDEPPGRPREDVGPTDPWDSA